MADQSRRSTRFSMRTKQLGQLLLENGDVQAEQVAEALKIQEQQGGLVGQVLQGMGACTGQAVAAALLKQVQITDVKCDDLNVSSVVVAHVAKEVCEAARLCPFERLGNLLCVVMGNPLDRKAITQIEERTKLKVKSFKAPWAKINELIQRVYSEDNQEADSGAAAEGEGDAPLSLEGEEGTGGYSAPLDLGDLGSTGMSEIESPTIESLTPNEPAPVAASSNQSSKQTLARRKQEEERAEAPNVIGMESLDDGKAEMIETNKRGLSQRKNKIAITDDDTPKPKAPKVAKINADLDTMDFTGGDVVGEASPDEEPLEEIAAEEDAEEAADPASTGLVLKLKRIEDSYFYADGAAPSGVRSAELLQLIGTLPVAKIVAGSVTDYEAAAKPKPKPVEKPVLKADRALELQPIPLEAMTAVLISEAEFKKRVATMAEDPVGEWDWKYAAAGPLMAMAEDEA